MRKSQNIPEKAPNLVDKHRRQLVQLLFVFATVGLYAFAALNFLSQHYAIAVIEAAAATVALWASLRLGKTRHLHRWTLGFLLVVFGIMALVQMFPSGADNSYVWLLFMPVLAYSLLGLKLGLMISVPFMLFGIGNYLLGTVHEQPGLGEAMNLLFAAGLVLLFMHQYERGRAHAQKKLMELAATDTLTELPNRGRFQHVLQQSIAEAGRRDSGFALIVLDLDHFKEVNDTLGHDAGDHILYQLAHCLKRGIRSTDFVARLGGEEFAVILKDVDADDAEWLAEHLHRCIVDYAFNYENKSVPIRATLGVALYPEDADNPTDLYKVADQHLYQGKEQGRDQVVLRRAAIA